jgi:hypothetical protein
MRAFFWNRAVKKNMPEQATDEAAKKHAADVLAIDEFAGKGGSYTFDPTSGVRTPAQQPEATTLPTEKE